MAAVWDLEGEVSEAAATEAAGAEVLETAATEAAGAEAMEAGVAVGKEMEAVAGRGEAWAAGVGSAVAAAVQRS